jgi:uncharacterized protein (DUF486 family)
VRTVLLLLCSNAFMTLAWYGHLGGRFRAAPLVSVILVSWLIALPEYALQVPANRLGIKQFTPAQLKIIQEVISISVFVLFNLVYFEQWPRWNEWLAFGLIVAAVLAMVYPKLVAAAPAGTARSTVQAAP